MHVSELRLPEEEQNQATTATTTYPPYTGGGMPGNDYAEYVEMQGMSYTAQDSYDFHCEPEDRKESRFKDMFANLSIQS